MMKPYAALFAVLFLMACSNPAVVPEKPAPAPVAVTPTPEPKPAVDPVPVPPVPAVTPAVVPAPAIAPQPEAPKVAPNAEWRVKNKKLVGPGNPGKASVLSRAKNKKGGGESVETCYDFGRFAIVEMKSTTEVGSAELNLRQGDGKLCAAKFKGTTLNLKIREGFFVGIAGDLVVVDGADDSEILTEFQVFDVASGKELFRAQRHPAHAFSLARINGKYSASYFAKLNVRCEIASEGLPCWKRIVKENRLPPGGPLPPCEKSFAEKKKDKTEPALMTALARVADLNAPKPTFIEARATCEPEI